MADEQLKSRVDEVLRISTNLITAVNGIRDDVKEIRGDVKKIKVVQESHSHRLEHIESDISTLKHGVKFLKKEARINSGMITDVASRVVDIISRLFDMEKHILTFDGKFANLEKEYKQIVSELIKINDAIDDSPKTVAKVKELDSRVEKLEEEVFA